MSNENFWTDELIMECFKKWVGTYNNLPFVRVLEQFKQEQLSKRDWEIISYEVAGNIYRVENDDKDYCNVNGDMYFKRIKVSDLPATKQIYSIRRLSDGEVFCVGDEAGSRYSYDSFIIEKIEIKDEPHLMAKGWLVPLQNARKVKKQVLFLTEDLVEITDRETVVYYIDENVNVNTRKAKNVHGSLKCKKIYAKAENAYDYILRHRKLLSLDDLLSVWDERDLLPRDKEYYAESPMFKTFEQLAKSKMDKK